MEITNLAKCVSWLVRNIVSQLSAWRLELFADPDIGIKRLNQVVYLMAVRQIHSQWILNDRFVILIDVSIKIQHKFSRFSPTSL